MKQKRISAFLALACAFMLASPISAASAAPALTGESCASAITKIYNYIPLAENTSYTSFSDYAYYTATERVYDNKGNFYRIADASPLADQSLFSLKTEIPIGAPYIRSVTQAVNPDAETKSSFKISLSRQYSGERTLIELKHTYTCLEDTTLLVNPTANPQETVELPVQKGAKIISTAKLLLDDDSISVSNYIKGYIKES